MLPTIVLMWVLLVKSRVGAIVHWGIGFDIDEL